MHWYAMYVDNESFHVKIKRKKLKQSKFIESVAICKRHIKLLDF